MRRLLYSLLWGLLLLGAMQLFIMLTPLTSLPPILDYLAAPGFFVVYLFRPCGVPEEVHRAAIRELVVISYIVNFVIYTALVHGILWLREHRSLRLP